ncbi:MAG: bifunctional 4-hydroxy-2-oxoglutarate aldolase/2-dehydro-3-deoxy-phosphogluconate aldolase [Legionellaceae bacterium]
MISIKNDQFMMGQSMMIALDVDAFLFDKLLSLSDAGFSVVELNGLESSLFTNLSAAFPQLCIGVGSIVSIQQLEEAYLAGAHFATSPGFLPELVQTADIYSMNYIPGVATPSEAMHALSLGCEQVRPYPATFSFCSLLNNLLPSLRLFPADIDPSQAAQFLHLPSVSAVSVLNPEISQLRRPEVV